MHPLHQFVLRARGALQRQRHVTRLLHLQAEELLVGAGRKQEVVIPAIRSINYRDARSVTLLVHITIQLLTLSHPSPLSQGRVYSPVL